MKAHELGSAAITGALIRSNVRPEEVSDVIMGQVGASHFDLVLSTFGEKRCLPSFSVGCKL